MRDLFTKTKTKKKSVKRKATKKKYNCSNAGKFLNVCKKKKSKRCKKDGSALSKCKTNKRLSWFL